MLAGYYLISENRGHYSVNHLSPAHISLCGTFSRSEVDRVAPDEDEPMDAAETIVANETFMQSAPFPKLFIKGGPGMAPVTGMRETCRKWPNQK